MGGRERDRCTREISDTSIRRWLSIGGLRGGATIQGFAVLQSSLQMHTVATGNLATIVYRITAVRAQTHSHATAAAAG